MKIKVEVEEGMTMISSGNIKQKFHETWGDRKGKSLNNELTHKLIKMTF